MKVDRNIIGVISFREKERERERERERETEQTADISLK